MNDTGYKNDDPWHSWINLVFDLMCEDCHRKIKFDWSQVVDDGNEDFLRQCVAVAERAQNEGWKPLGGTNFLCSNCWIARQKR
jgi:hypothetical protein